MTDSRMLRGCGETQVIRAAWWRADARSGAFRRSFTCGTHIADTCAVQWRTASDHGQPVGYGAATHQRSMREETW